jgi:hypothetical protein
MSLVGLLVFIIIMGLLYWVVTLIPLPAPFKTIALVVLLLICIVYLASAFGLFASGPILRVR